MSQFFKVKLYCKLIHLLLGRHWARLGASFFAVSLALGATQASAQPGKMGPRAGASAATVCAIEGSDFTVEIRVRDKTSGDAIPQVTAWSIDALAKTGTGNWDNQEKFADSSLGGLSLAMPATIGPERFSLCVNAGGYYIIDPVIAAAKGLNAMAATTYGRLNQDKLVVEDQRTIMNMCSDDPETLDVVEPSGIKLTPEDIELIAAACAVKVP